MNGARTANAKTRLIALTSAGQSVSYGRRSVVLPREQVFRWICGRVDVTNKRSYRYVISSAFYVYFIIQP